MTTRRVGSIFAAVLLAALGSVTGCESGPAGKVSEVEGTVTLDGTPLAKVYVSFAPEDNGGGKFPSSRAMTDETGHFVLYTADNRKGAIVGKHSVTLQSERADERSKSKGSPRQVPEKYTKPGPDNTLSAEVVEAKKTGYDFELKSK